MVSRKLFRYCLVPLACIIMFSCQAYAALNTSPGLLVYANGSYNAYKMTMLNNAIDEWNTQVSNLGTQNRVGSGMGFTVGVLQTITEKGATKIALGGEYERLGVQTDYLETFTGSNGTTEISNNIEAATFAIGPALRITQPITEKLNVGLQGSILYYESNLTQSLTLSSSTVAPFSEVRQASSGNIGLKLGGVVEYSVYPVWQVNARSAIRIAKQVVVGEAETTAELDWSGVEVAVGTAFVF